MKSLFVKLSDFFEATTNALSSCSLLLARLVLGLVFLPAGWGKLHNLERTIDFFASLGIPLPHYQAPFVAMVETLGGLFLLLGLATRWVSLPLMVIMVVAIATAHYPSMELWRDLLDLSDFLYFVLLFLVLTQGPGQISLDSLIGRLRRVRNGSH